MTLPKHYIQQGDLLDWVRALRDHVTMFMEGLKCGDQSGRFLPCRNGITNEGQQVLLGFSCFGLKIYYTLGLWENLSLSERKSWTDYIKSFQTARNLAWDTVRRHAFIDQAVIAYLAKQVPLHQRLVSFIRRPRGLTYLRRVIIAETKQAIATLYQVGEQANRPYLGFPVTCTSVKSFLARLNWAQPWEAGAHLSALAVFLSTQAVRFLPMEVTQALLRECTHFINGVVDRETGAYFQGPVPEHGTLVNGAMKVLSALDWLDVPIHYPERLIDTCLSKLPLPHGCHIVDYIYVLYRCTQQTDYRKRQIEVCCQNVLDILRKHYNQEDGGFSYNIGKSQGSYYGVPITEQLQESDIHGTLLLLWAIAMIFKISNHTSEYFEVIRP